MAKRLFLLLFIGLEWVLFGFDFLSATDMVVTKVSGYDAVETVLKPEPEPPLEQNTFEVLSIEPAPVYHYVAPIPAPAPVLKNYTVTSVTDQIVEYPSYYDVYRTGKFLYAHNSSNLFGSIVNLDYGEIFTITESGIVRSYRVMDKAIFEKAPNGYLNGSLSTTREAEINAYGYDISMMTCFGTMYGNGDASHRFMIFANAI